MKAKRQEMEELEREVTEPPKRELKKDHRLIPGSLFYYYYIYIYIYSSYFIFISVLSLF